ncbi:MAG TPA: hypothetical protein VEK57_03680 [Thermoanaerobaculia bacterium]|nr:hypothetical protein [Thermoanaerobaculia bacterium]
MSNRLHAGIVATLLGVAASLNAAGGLEIVPPGVIVIASDTPAATGTIAIRNSGNAPVKLRLSAGPFVSERQEPLMTAAKFPPVPEPIAAGETVPVTVELSNVTEPGYSTAELRNGSARIGELRVLKRVFSFNVAPLGFDSKQPFPIQRVQDEPATLTLFNPDPVTHSFDWSLRQGHRELAGGRVPLLRPNATVDINLPRERGSFLQTLEGTLQSPQSQASLLLRAVPQSPSRIGEYWVSKDIPLQLQRTAGVGAGRDLRQISWILLLLLLGGLTSLYLSYWVPNMLKKINVKAKIEDLTARIHQLRRTPSTLRVLLSVQRNQLRARLDSRNVLSLDFLALAAECEQQAKVLQRHIDVIQKIEHMLLQIEREWESGTTHGPTVLRRMEALLDKSAAQLEQGELPEEELRAVEAQVNQAKQTLGTATEDAKLIAEVLARAVELQRRKKELQPLVAAVGSLAPALDIAKVEDVAWPVGFWKLDYAVTKMEVAASVPETEQPKLLKLLQAHSIEAFEEAIGQARQMREAAEVPEQLKKALQDKKVHVSFHPERPTVNALVSFELELNDPTLNSSAAKRTLSCQWDFNDDFHEYGWRVSHYFRHAGTFNVKAAIKDRNDSLVSLEPVELTVTRQKDDVVGTRTRIELIRLGVALLVVLLSLVAGAKDQLAKLDFVPALVALFLLGVTADQIKNLLAPRTEK